MPVWNDILHTLLNSEYKQLSPKLEQVQLKRGGTIYQADQRIDHVYFPETAVVAMIDTVEGGGTVEVGIIGTACSRRYLDSCQANIEFQATDVDNAGRG